MKNVLTIFQESGWYSSIQHCHHTCFILELLCIFISFFCKLQEFICFQTLAVKTEWTPCFYLILKPMGYHKSRN